MSTIQEKINTLQPYLSGIRYLDGLQLVDATFKDGWVIPESKIIKKEKIEGNYFMFYSEDKTVTIDDLLDFIGSIINLNIEREKKYELLKIKVKELQEIFKEHPLTKLETLKFVFNDTYNNTDDIPDFDLFDTNIINETSTNEELNQTKTTINAQITDSVTQSNPKAEYKEVLSTYEYEDEDDYEKEARLHEEAAIKAQQEKLMNKVNGKTKTVHNIELPPKKGIEVEVYDLPEEMKSGDCNCGPEEACPKCMDEKSL